ncbi:hypothetical protein QQ008_09390 [Fulvivirgaceae bacterium BMA10]|uniref:Lipoprotein n=1 Tax=Splendidivirga corallicola TaxID=3051826 RepID=A0ABT8KLH5_9BACT|nr:hypothetical protein [Fulvivirgaceae bacterium BMA10]
MNYKYLFSYKSNIGYFLLLCTVVLLGACDIGDNNVEPGENIVKIYNNENFAINYDPLDIKQTSDGGFIILSSVDVSDTYLLKINELGEFVSDTLITSPFTHPLPNLFEIGGDFYFFSMDDISLATHLTKINLSDSSQAPEIIRTYTEIIYPLAVSQTPDGGFIIQSYNRDSRSSKLTKLDANFAESWNNEYEVLEDVENTIIGKFSGTAENLPYFTGSMNDGSIYFFNGFYNFSLSVVFVNSSDGDLIGTLNGLRDETGLSAAQHITGNSFAVSRFSFDDNFLLPLGDINVQANDFSGDLGGNELPEILPSAKVVIKRLTINGQNVVLYGSETKSKQIVLYAYDESDGALLGTKYFGNVNPYEIGNFVETTDGGLAISGRTFVAGRFPRICLFKISETELNSIVP